MSFPNWQSYCGFDQVPEEILAKHIHTSPIAQQPSSPDEPLITWLGHACFLIRWKELNIILDPVFTKRIGPATRRFPIPDLSLLPDIDLAIVSHGHMDHLDNASLLQLKPKVILLPKKSDNFLSNKVKSQSKIVTIEEGTTFPIGTLNIQAHFAHHGGWRYQWNFGYKALSFTLSDGNQTLYFCGDSAYGPHFKTIGKEHNITTALLPIGAYSPRWFLKSRHMNPEEAIQAFRDLGATNMHPFHFGCYRVSLDPLHEPFTRFTNLAVIDDIPWQLNLTQER